MKNKIMIPKEGENWSCRTLILTVAALVCFVAAGIPIKNIGVERAAAADKTDIMTDTYTVLRLVQGEYQTGEANVHIRDRASITITLVNSEFNAKSRQDREEKSKQLKGKVVSLMQKMRWPAGETLLTIGYSSHKKKFFIVDISHTIDSYLYKIVTRIVEPITKPDSRIVNMSGKCLDVQSPCQHENGCKIQVWECNGQLQQQWLFASGTLRSGAGMCLDVQSHCQNENGCKVQVWECNGNQQQRWQISDSTIRTATGKCLDVNTNCQNNNGCDVNIWDCNAQPQQQWTMNVTQEK